MGLNGWEALTLAGVIIALCVMSTFVGRGIGVTNMRQEAVKHGVAEWVVVDESGNTEFRWKAEELK